MQLGGSPEPQTEQGAESSEGENALDEAAMVETSEEVVEDLLSPLLQSTETDFLSDIGSATGSDNKKRKN